MNRYFKWKSNLYLMTITISQIQFSLKFIWHKNIQYDNVYMYNKTIYL